MKHKVSQFGANFIFSPMDALNLKSKLPDNVFFRIQAISVSTPQRPLSPAIQPSINLISFDWKALQILSLQLFCCPAAMTLQKRPEMVLERKGALISFWSVVASYCLAPLALQSHWSRVFFEINHNCADKTSSFFMIFSSCQNKRPKFCCFYPNPYNHLQSCFR